MSYLQPIFTLKKNCVDLKGRSSRRRSILSLRVTEKKSENTHYVFKIVMKILEIADLQKG
ncbi:hypothetical protein LEP1GSC193_0429 [Leptospira alstonii serovar Pingchang str. 80-412]|uniref:Uncharacterized protein n=2 Tax=Leptospira alstonii TaxID=28452 RepID=M6D5R5_9LEPT|nr:hypothetical protein LEP1GSC194_1601 [Leptospira alstonii serovar Sichuan str. 79601]EQA79142.1 hypothetical protein LEP1GSC193_0429 [Leptospira alstonii serovar Pingchang str. 80-412]